MVSVKVCNAGERRSGKYATGGRKRLRPHKVYMFLISIARRVDLAMSACPSVSTQNSLLVLKLSGTSLSVLKLLG